MSLPRSRAWNCVSGACPARERRRVERRASVGLAQAFMGDVVVGDVGLDEGEEFRVPRDVGVVRWPGGQLVDVDQKVVEPDLEGGEAEQAGGREPSAKALQMLGPIGVRADQDTAGLGRKLQAQHAALGPGRVGDPCDSVQPLQALGQAVAVARDQAREIAQVLLRSRIGSSRSSGSKFEVERAWVTASSASATSPLASEIGSAAA